MSMYVMYVLYTKVVSKVGGGGSSRKLEGPEPPSPSGCALELYYGDGYS